MKRAMVGLLLSLVISCTASLAQSRSDFPVVVARVKLTGQTAAINPTTIFSPRSTGLFRMSVVGVTTVPGGNGRWEGTITWNDVAPEFTVFDQSAGIVGSHGLNSFAFTASAGSHVKLSTTPSGDTTGSVYDVFIVIERLTKIPSF